MALVREQTQVLAAPVVDAAVILSTLSLAQIIHLVPAQFTLLVLWPGNSLKTVEWGNGRAHFIFTPRLRITIICC